MTNGDPFGGEEKANCEKGRLTPFRNLCVDSLIVASRKLENGSREPNLAHGPTGPQIVTINRFDPVVGVGRPLRKITLEILVEKKKFGM